MRHLTQFGIEACIYAIVTILLLGAFVVVASKSYWFGVGQYVWNGLYLFFVLPGGIGLIVSLMGELYD